MADEKVEPTSVQEALEEGKSVFAGHPADVPPDESTEESEETSEETTEEESEEKVASEEKPEEKTEPDKPVFKYESHEKAEEGALEANRLMTEKADEAKRERERAENLQTQLNDALLKVKPEPEPEPDKPKGPTSTERMGALLNQINVLDPEEDGYQEKVAALWGELEDERRASSDADVDARVKALIGEYDTRKADEQKQVETEKANRKAVVEQATTEATGAGLDMKEGSADDALFWAMSHTAPAGSTEEQIAWTIDAVKKHKATIVAPYVESTNKAKKTQEKNAVLERGGLGKPEEVAKPETPMSLSDALVKAQRRI